MKIKVKERPYSEVAAMEKPKHRHPKKPNWLFRVLVYALSIPDLYSVKFKSEKIGMEKIKKGQPCLYLMNHSSFIDLKIASRMIYPNPYNIVCTSDGFVGKNWLMRQIGCIPTKKFVTDLMLVRDINYCVNKLNSSVLMYPEASYSFDGRATTLPDSLGMLCKMLKIPVVTIITSGAFLRDPLYNGLQQRKVQVTAKMEYLLSPEEIEQKSTEEINAALHEKFSFDNFKAQQENHIRVGEPFRADGLERVLYKCPHCLSEGSMKGEGTEIGCETCGARYELDEYGYLKAKNVQALFSHIPDWFDWERACVKEELEEHTYQMDYDVDIYMMVDTKCIYSVGEGHLTHTCDGFHLTGCNGQLDFSRSPSSTYSLYSDYFWYEIGDTVCIGDTKTLYYCFPKGGKGIVAKARLATEELYRMTNKHIPRTKKAETTV